MILALLPLLLTTGAVPVAERHDTPRPDGTAIHWSVENADGAPARSPAILVMQGTGCEPVAEKPNLAHAGRLLVPGARTILIDKVGAESSTPGPRVEGCSQTYWDRYTLSGRVEDVLRVIADLRRQAWWNGRIVIFGGSEGGAVAALVAPLIPETAAVVILSSGAGVPVGDLIRAAVPPDMAAQAPAIFAAARARPTGQERWAGLSYRWWADAMDVVPARSLARSPAPVLLIHGARDQSSPVATARAGRDLLLAAGKADTDYREYADYDHFMCDRAGGAHMDSVLQDAARWIAPHLR
ncbi:alpha/beta fold hydrolase [Sphingomonas sp.]|uniref:alpha/beta hydrolase family protein n=1 Tax=Sphingomonas sp. TaxID=28214 RepID=UPI001EC30CDF|nr:alpha/beta fold hydrolase [Sphingomonas sp.]MBX3595571.1 prolyl oligopeptidase family serine peptidase [Sphingomonas sp.]